MTSEIRANTLKNRVGLGTISFTNTGPVVSGIITSLGADINGDLDVDGVSTFSDHVSIPDDKELRIGNSADLKLVHTTSLSSISSGGVNNFTIRQSAGSGFLFIHGDQLHLRSQSTNEPYLIATNNGPVSLYYDQNNHNTAKLVTTATGVTIDGTAVAGGLDISGDIDVDGHTNLDNLSVAGVSTFSDDVTFTTANGNNIVFDKSDNSLQFGDSVAAKFGSGNDLSLFHTGSVGVLRNSQGNFKIEPTSGEKGLVVLPNAGVELYYDNVQKLVTTSSGISVAGTIVATGADINGDLDVDGHTNLDNVSVAGVSTFT